MPNPRRQDRELDGLYASLPRLDCQGFCFDSCGPIEMSVRERARVVERARGPVKCEKNGLCSMLTADHRCSVYDVRPMICRLWGLTRRMPCPYGCRPEGGLLDDRDGMRLMLEADRLGGSPDRSERELRLGMQMIDALSDEDLVAVALETIGRGRATVAGRMPTLHRTGRRAPFEQPGMPVGDHGMAYPENPEVVGDENSP